MNVTVGVMTFTFLVMSHYVAVLKMHVGSF